MDRRSHSREPVQHRVKVAVVRLRCSNESLNGLQPFTVPDVFKDAVVTRIEVVAKDRSLVIKVDGAEKLRSPLPQQPFENWDRGYRMALGNEHTWNRPWLGEVLQATIETSSTSIDLLDRTQLTAPPFDLSLADIDIVSSDWLDLFVNFVFLIPVGIISARCFANRDALYVFVLWLPIVIFAEGLQLFVHVRQTSVTDVVLNLAGVTMGAYAAHRSGNRPLLHRHRS